MHPIPTSPVVSILTRNFGYFGLTILALLLSALLSSDDIRASTTQKGFGDGEFQVGSAVAPGTYIADIDTDGACSVGIRSADGAPRELSFLKRAIITLVESDTEIISRNCGEWVAMDRSAERHTQSQFDDGMYEIGIDVQPGTYASQESNGRCLWFNVDDFRYLDNVDQTLTWWRVGTPIVEIRDSDTGFYSARCGTWSRVDAAESSDPLPTFPDGSYLVGKQISPGTYRASATEETCNWFRTSPFGGEIADNSGGYASSGSQIVTLLSSDTGFFSEGCGEWTPFEPDRRAGDDEVIGTGTYAIGVDVEPGPYAAEAVEGRFCRWFTLRGFTGRSSDIEDSGVGVVRGIVDIPQDVIGFRSFGCETWEPVHINGQAELAETFGDGEHIVGVNVAPGIYGSPGAETGRCIWSRSTDFSGDDSARVAQRNPVGKNIAEIFKTDAIFESFGCGEWGPLAAREEPIDRFGRGTWAVHDEILPGTYVAPIREGVTCFWSRMSGFTGQLEDLLASDVAVGHAVMTLNDYDAGFYSDGCEEWVSADAVLADYQRFAQRSFGDGVYIVGTNIAPGTYVANGSEDETCYWSRLTGFDGDFFTRLTLYASEGQAIATIIDSDVGFRSLGCGTWSPAEAIEVRRPASQFDDGTYRVGTDIVPGTYIVSEPKPGVCRWRRVSDFTWTSGTLVEKVSIGRTIVTILETDVGFASINCGRWEMLQEDVEEASQAVVAAAFGDGSYVVGQHIAPGTYVALPRNNSSCTWSRMSRFTGDGEDTIAQGKSNGRWLVTIDATDAGFITLGCGRWLPVEHSLDFGVLSEFEDGVYRIGTDVRPGRYLARVSEERFKGGRPVPRCVWKRLAGFGHTTHESIATGSGRGKVEIVLEDGDTGVLTIGCGTFTTVIPSLHNR